MDRIAELEARIAELRARIPKHSAQPAMLEELEDLEIELDEARAAAADHRGAGPEGADS